jgi:hypothetical protein
MDLALGLRAHSGWAALVALGCRDGEPVLVERRRIEMIDPGDAYWAKQPYHAAEGLDRSAAHDVVRRGIESAQRVARRELGRAAQALAANGHRARACGVLVGAGMPGWSVDEILSVHFRMHKAEGELFRSALLEAAEACDLATLAIPEKQLREHAQAALRRPGPAIDAALRALGRAAGPPWAADQKSAALAAWIAHARLDA